MLKIDDHNNKFDPSEEEAKRLVTSLDEAWAKLKSMYPDKPWSSSDAKPDQEPTSQLRNYIGVALRLNAWRAMFLTKEGQLGLAGGWVEEGEVVMLVESGYVPYVFKLAEQTAKEQVKSVKGNIENIRKEPQPLSPRTEGKLKKWKGILDQLQSRMDKQAGAWALDGEAYVHSVMHGEAMDDESLVFEPIAVN